MLTDDIGFIFETATPDEALEECVQSHSFYFHHADEIVAGRDIGKTFDEVRLSYPGKDESVTDGMFRCNRLGCFETFRTSRDRK